jgi:hypothetical protein
MPGGGGGLQLPTKGNRRWDWRRRRPELRRGAVFRSQIGTRFADALEEVLEIGVFHGRGLRNLAITSSKGAPASGFAS